jgi:serine/threonine-protein kinase
VQPGLLLGDFRLVELIGSGGMGEVWRAENARLTRIVRAIKVIRPQLAATPEFRQRFMREAEILELLQHPNILRVENVSEQHGLLFMVMELLQGSPADRLIREADRRLPVEHAARIAVEAATGLAFAHDNGVLHRDIKPGNLFVTTAGVVKVLDFGIARTEDAARVTATGAGQPATPAYFAPELALGSTAPSPTSDVYSLGITLFELLAGTPPFVSEPGLSPSQAAMSLMYQHVHREMPDVRERRPDVPEELARIIRVATSKDPSQRYPDARVLAGALTPFAAAPLPPATPRPQTTPPAETPSARRRTTNPPAPDPQGASPPARVRTTAPPVPASTPAHREPPDLRRAPKELPPTLIPPSSQPNTAADEEDHDEEELPAPRQRPRGDRTGIAIAVVVLLATLILIFGIVAGGRQTEMSAPSPGTAKTNALKTDGETADAAKERTEKEKAEKEKAEKEKTEKERTEKEKAEKERTEKEKAEKEKAEKERTEKEKAEKEKAEKEKAEKEKAEKEKAEKEKAEKEKAARERAAKEKAEKEKAEKEKAESEKAARDKALLKEQLKGLTNAVGNPPP